MFCSINNVVIIGSGPSGLTSAIYCSRAGLNPIVIAGSTIGGALTKTDSVENFPGFLKPVTGFRIMSVLHDQAQKFGAKILYNTVKSVDFTDNKAKRIILDDGKEILTKSVIIATGSKPLPLNVKNEDKFISKGVSYCAVCDGSFFKNMPIVVVGGGDTAVGDVMFLSRMTDDITLIHRRDQLKASKYLVSKLNDYNVKIIWNSVVEELIGNDDLKQLKIKNLQNNSISIIKCNGCFVALGNRPDTDIFKGKLNLDNDGYIITSGYSTATNVQGVFASGDCIDKNYKQAIVASGMGCKAALDVERWLNIYN